jgi:23S rRNA pseudouridine1911/1915/1917 synthase
LQFIHPVQKEKVDIFAPLPKDGFWDKFESFNN